MSRVIVLVAGVPGVLAGIVNELLQAQDDLEVVEWARTLVPLPAIDY